MNNRSTLRGVNGLLLRRFGPDINALLSPTDQLEGDFIVAKTADTDSADNAKDKDQPDDAVQQETAAETAPAADAEQPAAATITIDDGNLTACYANFCRVSSSPEELVLDLGLNPNPYGSGHTIRVSQRIILNHYTAKRLLSALSVALQRHEQTFGVLETDVRKRVRGNS